MLHYVHQWSEVGHCGHHGNRARTQENLARVTSASVAAGHVTRLCLALVASDVRVWAWKSPTARVSSVVCWLKGQH